MPCRSAVSMVVEDRLESVELALGLRMVGMPVLLVIPSAMLSYLNAFFPLVNREVVRRIRGPHRSRPGRLQRHIRSVENWLSIPTPTEPAPAQPGCNPERQIDRKRERHGPDEVCWISEETRWFFASVPLSGELHRSLGGKRFDLNRRVRREGGDPAKPAQGSDLSRRLRQVVTYPAIVPVAQQSQQHPDQTPGGTANRGKRVTFAVFWRRWLVDLVPVRLDRDRLPFIPHCQT